MTLQEWKSKNYEEPSGSSSKTQEWRNKNYTNSAPEAKPVNTSAPTVFTPSISAPKPAVVESPYQKGVYAHPLNGSRVTKQQLQDELDYINKQQKKTATGSTFVANPIEANKKAQEAAQLQAALASITLQERADAAGKQEQEYASRKESPNAKHFVEAGKNSKDNVVEYSRANWEKIAYDETKGIKSNKRSIYRHMTDDQVQTYNYILGKDGNKAANDYLKSIEDQLAQKEGEAQATHIENMGGIGEKVSKGVYAVASGSSNALEGMRQNRFEDALPAAAMQYGSQQIRSNLKGVGGVAYDVATQVGNMLPSIVVSMATGPFGKVAASGYTGLSAKGNAYNQALKQDYSKEQANTYSTMIGISEGVLQYLLSGIGKLGGVTDDVLLAKVKGIDNALARLALTGAIKIGGEVAEEELQLVIEPTLRSLILNEEFDAPTWDDVAYTALLSALSVTALEGPSGAVNLFSKTAQDIKNKRTANPLAPAQGNAPQTTTDAPEINAPQIAENKPQTMPTQEAQKPAEIGEGVQAPQFTDDGVGAANAGFADSAYNRLYDQSTEFHDEGANRDPSKYIEVPKKDFDGRNIPKSSSTIMGAKATPDRAVVQLQELIASGRLSFDTIKDKDVVGEAQKKIEQKHFWGAVQEYRDAVNNNVATKQNVALGQQLIIDAMNGHNEAALAELLTLYTRNSTNIAQSLQAQAMFRKLSPEGQLVALQKAVEAFNEKYGTEAEIDEADIGDFIKAEDEATRNEVADRIMKNIAKGVPKDFRAKFDAIRYFAMLGNARTHLRNIVGNTVFTAPVTVKNRVGAVGEILLNKATGGKTERTKSLVGVAPTSALAKAARADFDANAKDFLASFGGQYSEAKASLSAIEQQMKTFGEEGKLGKVGKAANFLIDGNSQLLEAEDMVAKKFHYTQALAGYLQANGVTAEQFAAMQQEAESGKKPDPKQNQPIIPNGERVKAADRDNYGNIVSYNAETNKYRVHFENDKGQSADVDLDAELISPLKPIKKQKLESVAVDKENNPSAFIDRARAYAAREALRNTFTDRNKFSDAVASLSKLQKSDNGFIRLASTITEGLLPFKRTPANILARAVEYSPVGAVIGAVDTIRGATNKNAEQITQGLDTLSAGVVGSAMLYVGWLLAASGKLRGAEDEDKDQAGFDDLLGHQAYALELADGTSVTLDWLAPMSIPLFMGVELQKAMQTRGLSLEEVLDSFKNISEPMLEMSMLQGLADVFESAAYAQNSGGSVLGSVVATSATNYFTQIFPTLFGQVERVFEDERMTTYADKNNALPTGWQYTIGKVLNKTPFVDYHQTPYIDAWGQTESTGNIFERTANNLLNPAYISKVEIDAVESELQKVFDATGDSGVLPNNADRYIDVNGERKNLTAEQYVKYAKSKGQLAYKYVQAAISSSAYKSMSSEDKADYISKMYEYANYKAKREIFASASKNDTEMKRYAEFDKLGISPAVVYAYKEKSDIDGNKSTSSAESAQTLLKTSGLSTDQRGQMWSIYNATSAQEKNPFTGALPKSGITPDASVGILAKYTELNGADLKVRDKAEKFKSYVYSLGLSKKQIDVVAETFKYWGSYPIEW